MFFIDFIKNNIQAVRVFSVITVFLVLASVNIIYNTHTNALESMIGWSLIMLVTSLFASSVLMKGVNNIRLSKEVAVIYTVYNIAYIPIMSFSINAGGPYAALLIDPLLVFGMFLYFIFRKKIILGVCLWAAKNLYLSEKLIARIQSKLSLKGKLKNILYDAGENGAISRKCLQVVKTTGQTKFGLMVTSFIAISLLLDFLWSAYLFSFGLVNDVPINGSFYQTMINAYGVDMFYIYDGLFMTITYLFSAAIAVYIWLDNKKPDLVDWNSISLPQVKFRDLNYLKMQ